MPDAGETGAGWLRASSVAGFYGCRNSAKTVFKKSETRGIAAAQTCGLFKNNADFRQPRIMLPSCRVVANRHPSPRLFGSGREVVVGVWGDWRKWGLMRAGGFEWIPGVG